MIFYHIDIKIMNTKNIYVDRFNNFVHGENIFVERVNNFIRR
jgi:hypothetical protein